MTEPTPRAELFPPTRLPAPAGSPARSSPAELESWIDRRQAGSPAQAAAVLSEVLRAINGVSVEYPALAALTEVLLVRAPEVLGQIERQLQQLPIPLGHKSQTLASAYAELSSDLLQACVRLVDEGLEQRRLKTLEAARYLRLAQLLTASRCLHFWRLYQPLPAHTWLQAYRILEVAEGLGVATDPSAERLGVLTLAPDSVERLAARAAVLSSAGVYALRHGEVAVLARWLESVPLRCTAEIPPGLDENSPLLRLLLQEDRAPSLVTGRPTAGGDRRFIDLAPVVDAIRAGAAQAKAGGWHPATSGMDRRLLNIWVVPPTRRFSREPADAEPIITVTGLTDIHALVRADLRHQRKLEVGDLLGLPGAGGSGQPIGDPRHIPAALAVGIGELEDDQKFSLTPAGNGSRSGDEARFLSDQKMDRLSAAWSDAVRGINPRLDTPSEPQAVHVLRPTAARLRNLGAGGLSLVLKSPAQKIYSGDLIAVRTARRERVVWQLGVIRWLCYEEAENVTVGIEYLAPACTPTDIRLWRSNQAVGAAQQGLFFHPHGKAGAGALVFAPGAFAEGTRVVFRLAGEERAVRLDSVRPESHTFSRADFPLPAGGGGG